MNIEQIFISFPAIERIILIFLHQEYLYPYASSSGERPNHLGVGHCTRLGGIIPTRPLADLPLYAKPFKTFTMVQCPGGQSLVPAAKAAQVL